MFSIAFVTLAACGGLGGGCGGCGSLPLPAGGLPKTQTIEGGGQIRVTRPGFTKLTQIIPPLLNQQLGNGFCVGPGSVGTPSGGFLATGARYCSTNQGATPSIPDACGAANGCNVGVHLDSTNISVTNAQRMNVRIQLDVNATVPLSGQVVGIGFSCSLSATGPNIVIDADIQFGIDPATGKLTMELAGINGLDTSDLSFNGCSVVSDVANLLNSLLNSFIGDFIIDLLTPTFNNLIQGFLPDPLGIEGMVDIGQLMAGVSPGTEGFMEARMIPGGYVSLQAGGMSLGLITGLNADQNPTTRTPDLISEPAYCVPPIPAPNFAAPPASLPASSRGTFTLAPANEFVGMPEPADDLAIGLSETTLDLAGHHLVTSGGMCLGVGTSLVSQLTLGTISLLVPSLNDVGEGSEPLLLVTRPQKALDFKIGDGTEASPALTIAIDDFEVDFYAFIFERYVRVFTMSLDMNVGVNLEFTQMPGQPATVKPILVGLTADQIGITVLNNEFVKESAAELEAVLPTVFNLALPLITGGIDPFPVPDFAGFTLNNLRVQKVTTSQDEFLAIYASLGASAMMRQLAADQVPGLTPVLDAIDEQAGLKHGWPKPVLAPTAQVRSVTVPTPDVVRAALAGYPGATLPAVTIDAATHDAEGRPLEWSWNLDGGMWRPFTSAAPLVISDKAFAWQGKYTIGLRARVVGDYRTTSASTVELPVVIDSVGPRILVEQAAWHGDRLTVPAYDVVYGVDHLEWAFGLVGDDLPATDWSGAPSIDRATAKDLANADGDLVVFVRDPSGNTSTVTYRTDFHGAPGEGGCNCDSSGGAPVGTLVLILLTGMMLLFRRGMATGGAVVVRARRRLASSQRYLGMIGLWLGVAALSSLVPGCSCGSKAGAQSCEVVEDCDLDCPEGQIPLCFDSECVCVSDVPYGRIGTHSDVAVGPLGDAVVSAYAQNHGDLVVARHSGNGRIPDEAWEFVDGVPDGPVALPNSTVRGGIFEPGPDVGLYTSVAVTATDTIMVSYYDRETGSLKFASKPRDGAWSNHVVEQGTGPSVNPEIGGEQAGLYTAITVGDDGIPGIAYYAKTSQGGNIVSAEGRYAKASTPNPASAGDWDTMTIDSMTLPPTDPAMPDPYPLPAGIGLFVESARDAAGNPVVAYYDRENGDLKVATWAGSGFAAPTVMAGAAADSGWYPSVAVDGAGTVHVAYQGADHDDVFYKNSMTNTQELVDDGYRIVGTTPDGLPKPEYHFVGADTQIVLTGNGPMVVYQDATSHELLVADKSGAMGGWRPAALAGNEQTWVGAYGFYASAALGSNSVTISTWVIDQQNADNWVELFNIPITPP
ncbi:MAG: hypothetical protein IPL61_31205 [Myxococcales bacterium]|nr:hypothetical protein [Myxococcales bacterium]